MGSRTLALAVSSAVVGSVIGSPVYWDPAAGGNGHSYDAIRVPSGIFWEDARDQAIALGGHLATLTSAAENQFVFDHLASDPTLWKNGFYGPWIGGYQTPGLSDPAAGWHWVTGEPWSYTNWGVGEPNDALGTADETLLHFDNLLDQPQPSPRWNDYRNHGGTAIIAYIVEFPVPAPGTGAWVTGVALLALRRRR